MMKSNHMKWLALVVVVGVSGCASGPGYREYSEQIPEVSQGEGRIFLYRAAAVGAAVQPKVRVNGEEVGKATPGGFFYIDRPTGSYEISTSTEAKRSLSLELDSGEERYVRLEMKLGFFVGHVKPVLVERSVGMDEIQKLKYTGEVE